MKTSKVVCNLVVVVAVINFIPVLGKRHNPGPDEIERVINTTHSVIWICSNSECQPGRGLNVQCGTSIPFSMPIECVLCVNGANYSDFHGYSTCKSCKNCGKYENRRGECTREEDNIVCLGTCHKGYYWDSITEDCHPCSHCCGEAIKHHEKQCEDSELPTHQQCRQTNIKCPHPTGTAVPIPEDPKGSLKSLEIAAIAIGLVLFVVIIAILLVIWKCYGWSQVTSALRRCCCWCCNLTQLNAGTVVNFHISDQFASPDCESGTLCINNSGSPLIDEKTDEVRSLPSDFRARAKTVSKKPGFQRQTSVPVEPRSVAKLKLPRSRSHPGCLVDLNKNGQESVDGKLSSLKKMFIDPKAKKLAMKGYAPVKTEVDDFPLLEVSQDSLPEQTSSASGEFTENSLQFNVGFTVEDHKKQRLEKPLAKDQGTSTTELHLFTSTLQKAGIPQYFINQLLQKSMSAITNKFYRKICIKLDILRECFWDDFRMLGEKVGLDKDEIAWLRQRGNPTELIIQKFNSRKNSCVAMFVAILEDEEMGRNDVVEIIEEWFVHEWNEHIKNNPSVCGKEYNVKTFV